MRRKFCIQTAGIQHADAGRVFAPGKFPVKKRERERERGGGKEGGKESTRDALDVCSKTFGSFRLVGAAMHTELFRPDIEGVKLPFAGCTQTIHEVMDINDIR